MIYKLFKAVYSFVFELINIQTKAFTNVRWGMQMVLTLMREVQTIAPALTMGLCGLSARKKMQVGNF